MTFFESLQRHQSLIKLEVCFNLFLWDFMLYSLLFGDSKCVCVDIVCPCLAFLIYALKKDNKLAMIFIVGFTICHVVYGIMNYSV